MPVYQYRGLDARSRKVSGLIDAESPKSAVQKLKKMEIFPIEITLSEERVRERKWKIPGLGERVSPAELAVMTRQLATMVGGGLPLVQALSALTEQIAHPRLKKVIAEVRELVNEGASFADALRQYPRIFSEFYVNMVEAGEQSGALEIVLERLADFTESQSELRSRLVFALLYPAMVLGIGLVVMIFMFTYVIPKISALFEETHQALPLITKLMLGLSFFLKKYLWILILLLIGGYFGFRRWRKTPRGKDAWDRFILRLPILGELARKLAIARFSRTLATLLQSGIPLLKSLGIVERVVNNTVIARAIAQARENITEGASIAGPLRASGVFPPFVVQMISAGEQSGELEFLLEKTAQAFERELESAVEGLMKILEPVMIVFIAVIVGIIIVSFLLPILELTQAIG